LLPGHRRIFSPHPSESTLEFEKKNVRIFQKKCQNSWELNEYQAPHKLVELLEISVLHQHHLYSCPDEASLQAFRSKGTEKKNDIVRQIAGNGNRTQYKHVYYPKSKKMVHIR
jgi:hypothetical protein